jgi:membrane protein YqaA with SNARE-associated domain
MLVEIFVIVLAINILPVFGPPTWIVLTYFQVKYGFNVFLLALIGTLAATLGRIILAKFASQIIRNKLLSERAKSNIDTIRIRLTEHKRITIGISLFYSFTPLPSNQLFLAYGLTDLPLKYIAAPFFLGRFVSYLFWVSTVSIATLKITAGEYARGTYLGTYYIIAQILTIGVVYVFTKIDWHKLFTEKKLTRSK